MFERFTTSARECVVVAQDEARELGHGYIGTEHLLIALSAEQRGLAGHVLRRLGVTPDELRAATRRTSGPGALDRDALASIGIDLDEVRRRVEEAFGPGTLDAAHSRCGATSGEIPFTPRSKKSLELALRTAVRLGDNLIGSEHLLLGIARVEDGTAAKLLADRGLTRERLEEAVRDARRAA